MGGAHVGASEVGLAEHEVGALTVFERGLKRSNRLLIWSVAHRAPLPSMIAMTGSPPKATTGSAVYDRRDREYSAQRESDVIPGRWQ
jgi:hypothetical protein